jgi:methylamine--corrinoid protein Co-methyltransferase
MLQTIGKPLDVYEIYERAKKGPKLPENEWDFGVVPKTAAKLRDKYEIKIDKKVMVPEDEDLIDRLFNAGVDMLEECGVYCIDTGRIIKYSREEILNKVKAAPTSFQFGEGREMVPVSPRAYNSKKPPVIQGGPTGSPCSEAMFLPIHQSYAQEPIVDTIVDGVVQTIHGYDPVPNSPWEMLAVRTELLQVREAQMRAGRTGMGL